MPDNQLAGTGHRGQFWLGNGASPSVLTRVNQVVSFGIPARMREWIETTHLDSDAKEYAPSLPDFDEFDVVLNFRPGSDTDEMLDDASEDNDPRDFKLVVPVRGVLTKQYEGQGYITYDPGEVTVDGKMESTVTVKMTGNLTPAPYAP